MGSYSKRFVSSRGQTVGPANKMEGDSNRGRLQAGATSATMPSANGASQRPSSAMSLSVPRPTSSASGRYSPSFPNPVTRTASACFPVTRAPSDKGLAMIKTKLHETTPPPTNMTWEEALAVLHKLEKQLTINVQMDLERMRYRMTMTKINLVARKSLNLYKMRILLNQTRRLVREEEDIMGDFTGVKAVIDSDPRGQLDEDDYMDTKGRLLNLGSKLTDNRRKQQRLAGQVEELQAATNALVDAAEMPEMEDHEFDMESFKRESSALPEMPRLAPSLPSYDLFNHAPYSPDVSRPGSAMSMESDRPGSALERIRERSLHRKLTVSVAVDSTDEEDVGNEAYLPQRSGLKKKKDFASRSKRAPSETSETSDGEDSAYNVFTNTRMTPLEAKHKAEEDRKRAAEVEEKLHEQLKKEEEEVKKKEEELQKKKSIGDDKKNSAPGAKQKTEQDAKAKQQQNDTT